LSPRPTLFPYTTLFRSISADRGAAKGNSPLDPRSTGIDPRPTPPVDLTANSVSQFITKVQPVLMNTCANCHGPAHTGPFQLERVDRKSTRLNSSHGSIS